MKKPLLAILSLCGVGFLVLGLITLFLNTSPAPGPNQPEQISRSSVPIVFYKGQSISSLAGTLAEKKLIRSAVFFKLYVRLSGNEANLKAGSYRINRGLSAIQIAQIFIQGRVYSIRITIPEGFTSRQIAILLEREGITARQSFLDAMQSPELLNEFGIKAQSAEGFLFPDTYLLTENEEASVIVRRMIDNFFRKLKDVPGSTAINGKDLVNKIILASIVEREYRLPEDAGKIARVFLNRLNIGMPLQSCATIVYILTERMGKPHPEKIYLSDLDIQDPYNTYRNRGLPPGPIANPGITSLNAVFNPPQNDYLFFRLSGDESGSHIFSTSFDEHIQNGISVKGY